jgi:hypothetical protein
MASTPNIGFRKTKAPQPLSLLSGMRERLERGTRRQLDAYSLKKPHRQWRFQTPDASRGSHVLATSDTGSHDATLSNGGDATASDASTANGASSANGDDATANGNDAIANGASTASGAATANDASTANGAPTALESHCRGRWKRSPAAAQWERLASPARPPKSARRPEKQRQSVSS